LKTVGLSSITESHDHKLILARFFNERILPESAAHLAKLQSGAETLMALPSEMF
jgi:acyl-CoA dehydrogenase